MTLPEVMTLLMMNAPEDDNGTSFSDDVLAEKVAELDMTDEEWRVKHGAS